jgi:hypothetical protein
MRYSQTITIDKIGDENYCVSIRLDPKQQSADATARKPFDSLSVYVGLQQKRDDVHIYAAGIMQVNRKVRLLVYIRKSVRSSLVVGTLVVGALVVGALVVGALVVGALVVGALVVGALVVGALVVGALVVGALVVGALVVGALVVGALVVGACFLVRTSLIGSHHHLTFLFVLLNRWCLIWSSLMLVELLGAWLARELCGFRVSSSRESLPGGLLLVTDFKYILFFFLSFALRLSPFFFFLSLFLIITTRRSEALGARRACVKLSLMKTKN